jgi:signal peptidase I
MRDSAIFTGVVEEALAKGTTVRFRAQGTSMSPTIRDGEAISIAAVSPDEVVRGDVLLCRHDKRVLAHRVVGVTTHGAGRVFELRGDAKAGSDTPVGADDVVGQVIAVQRNGRLVGLCGRGARLRHAARTAAACAKSLVVSTAIILHRGIVSCWPRRFFRDDGLRI